MTQLPARRSSADPISLMDDFTAYMNRMMGQPYFSPLDSGDDAWAPTADVTENDEVYHIDIELPGVEKGDITVDLEGQDLMVTGESKKFEHIEGSSARRMSRRIGKFEYSLRLPHAIDADSCHAELADGVLCVTVSKSSASGHKKIQVT
jgi:HSP20 family protein